MTAVCRSIWAFLPTRLRCWHRQVGHLCPRAQNFIRYHALSISGDAIKKLLKFLTCHSRPVPLASLQLRVCWPVEHPASFCAGPCNGKGRACRGSGRGCPSHRLLWPLRGCARSVEDTKWFSPFAHIFANVETGEIRYITGNRTHQTSTLFLAKRPLNPPACGFFANWTSDHCAKN